MKLAFFILAGALAMGSCNANETTTENTNAATANLPQNGTKKSAKTVRSAEVKNLIAKKKDLVIIDVRTPEEFSQGHLKNAVLINKYEPDFEAKIKALDPDKTYLIYCAKGGRSGDASRMMQNLGFKNIYDATEGFNTLKEAGIPVEK